MFGKFLWSSGRSTSDVVRYFPSCSGTGHIRADLRVDLLGLRNDLPITYGLRIGHKYVLQKKKSLCFASVLLPQRQARMHNGSAMLNNQSARLRRYGLMISGPGVRLYKGSSRFAQLHCKSCVDVSARKWSSVMQMFTWELLSHQK